MTAEISTQNCAVDKKKRFSLVFESLCGVSNVKSYYCDTLPSQVLARKVEHESTVKIYTLLLDSSN